MSDKELLKAINLQNNGHHTQAAAILQREANRERPVSEKKQLWAAADRARKIAASD